MRTLLGMSLFLLPLSAEAGDDCKEAFEKGYAAGKEIQELRSEVRDLRAVVAKLVEMLGDRPEVASIELPKKEAQKPEPPPPAPERRFGTVAGKVTFLPGSSTAYVYVENVGGRLARGRKVNIAQKNKQFTPRFLVVQKGTEIAFPNEDPIYHNVFAQGPVANFDLGIYRRGDDAKSYVFTKPGVVDIFCNMHAKMSAQLLVVPNHLYAAVQPNGSFKLVRVPGGRRKIVAWAPGAEPVSAWVDVGDGTAEVKLALKPRDKGAHKNKDGLPYGSYQ